jgi:hypothetical protein
MSVLLTFYIWHKKTKDGSIIQQQQVPSTATAVPTAAEAALTVVLVSRAAAIPTAAEAPSTSAAPTAAAASIAAISSNFQQKQHQ